ncbi:MAG: class IV adenylate cyclase [Candidatus Hydrothermarchaeota archaeon]|nr:class IV adenylate cyclase [Candidatus Hydrothermarchaeota archaeon]
MLEIEAKARAKHEAVRSRLHELGAEYRGEDAQEDLYFAHPCRDFASTDEALRLRRGGKSCSMTYKGPKIDALTKTRIEHEIILDDFDAARAALKSLGFTEVGVVKKKRTYYSLEGFHVMLDEVEGLGEFVEVEKKGGEYEPGELLDILKILGIKNLIRTSYLELLLEEESSKNQ